MNKELKPHAIEWEKNKMADKNVIKRAAELGFGGLYVTEQSGGCGFSRLDSSVIFEALAQGDISTTALLTIHNMTAWMLDSFGLSVLPLFFVFLFFFDRAKSHKTRNKNKNKQTNI